MENRALLVEQQAPCVDPHGGRRVHTNKRKERNMKKKLFAILALVVLLSLVLAVTAFACHDTADCSPGFWKNHTEIWYGDYTDAADMLEILWAKGNSPLFQYRWDVTDTLNAAYPDANCD
jgi:hypothetical protein